MTTQELFEGLYKTLYPIVTEDKDIIELIEENNISKEDAESIITWLINATIGVMLNGATGAVEKKLQENCAHDMEVWENRLKKSGFGEDVGETLGKILEDNIGEWLEIVTKQFKKTKRSVADEDDDENVGGKEAQSDSPAAITFKLYNSFLSQVVAREDDVTDFIEKYSEIDKDVLLYYVTGNVFYAYLMEVKQGNIQPPKQSALMKNFDGILEIITPYMQSIHSQFIDGKVDHEEFQKDIQEIVNDHFNEFIKKMFKKIFAAMDEANK